MQATGRCSQASLHDGLPELPANLVYDSSLLTKSTAVPCRQRTQDHNVAGAAVRHAPVHSGANRPRQRCSVVRQPAAARAILAHLLAHSMAMSTFHAKVASIRCNCMFCWTYSSAFAETACNCQSAGNLQSAPGSGRSRCAGARRRAGGASRQRPAASPAPAAPRPAASTPSAAVVCLNSSQEANEQSMSWWHQGAAAEQASRQIEEQEFVW